jgi:hypothetical protein
VTEPTQQPGAHFVDGLRVTPLHLNHSAAVAADAVNDLRRIAGLGRVGAGFRIVVAGDAATLTPGIGFTIDGLPVRRDEPTALAIPDGDGPFAVGLRAVGKDDEATKVDDRATITYLLTEVVVAPDLADAPDLLVVGSVRRGADGLQVEQDPARFAPGPSHRHSGAWLEETGGLFRFDGMPVEGGGGQGSAGPQGDLGAQGPQGAQGAQGAQGVQGARGQLGNQGPQGGAGPQGSQGTQGAQGAAGQAGTGTPTDLTFLKSVNWDPKGRLPLDQALGQLAGVELSFTDALDPGPLTDFQATAVQVWCCPAGAAGPVRSLGKRLGVVDNFVRMNISVDEQAAAELRQLGGVVLIDIVCDLLLDRSGRPVSSSCAPALLDRGELLSPGGILRVGMRIGG